MVEILSRSSKNLLKTGVALVLSNVTGELLRETSRNTVQEIARDVRRIKSKIQEKREQKVNKAA